MKRNDHLNSKFYRATLSDKQLKNIFGGVGKSVQAEPDIADLIDVRNEDQTTLVKKDK